MGAPVTTDPTDVHGWTDTLLRGILQQLEGGGVPTITTPTRTDVLVAAASTLVLGANANRKAGSIIVCDTTAVSYFKLGTGASTSDFFDAVDGKTSVPGIFPIPDGYLGAIYGAGSSATGTWRATEFT